MKEFEISRVHKMLLRRLNEISHNSKGFTIAELMTAVAIISIMGAIAFPTFLTFQPTMRLNGGAREVLSKLMWARAEAVEQNTKYVVSFPSTSTILIYNDVNSNNSLDGGEWSQTINIQQDYSDVTVAISNGGANPRFTSGGTADSGTTEITVSNLSGSKTVQVLATGSVRIL